jgi:Protein of unknown function (DUF2924)
MGFFNQDEANQRLFEIAEILAAGLTRLEARKSVECLRKSEKVRFTSRPTRAVMRHPAPPRFPMVDNVLAQLAALKHAPAPALKAKWRALFDSEPPPYNRRFLESRLAYRIQELAYGGLRKETVERLRVLGKQYDGKPSGRPKARSLTYRSPGPG